MTFSSPETQDPEHWLTFVLHSNASSASVVEAARKAVMSVDSDLAVFNLGTADAAVEQSGANMVLIGHLLAIAAALGLFLSLVGIYGVVANLAVQRTHEIGIRMALGANAGTVLWLILRNGGRLAALGTGIGLALAFAISHGLGLMEPDIPGKDPALIVEMAVLLVAATLLACWLPAFRATRVNPVEALRAE
jgi:putative ABC transport system permease protein